VAPTWVGRPRPLEPPVSKFNFAKIVLFAVIAATPAVALAAQYSGTACFPWCPFCP
jgi:hypothetical protein